MNFPIVAEELQIGGAAVDHEAFHGAAVDQRNPGPRRSRARRRPPRAQIANQGVDVGLAQARKRRHARADDALTDDRSQLVVGSRWQARRDRRTELAAIAVGPVARGAAACEYLSPRTARHRLPE